MAFSWLSKDVKEHSRKWRWEGREKKGGENLLLPSSYAQLLLCRTIPAPPCPNFLHGTTSYTACREPPPEATSHLLPEHVKLGEPLGKVKDS